MPLRPVFVVLALGALLVGCPPLKDDYEIVNTGGAGGKAGNGGTGGGVDSSAGGVAGIGGVSGSGGDAGAIGCTNCDKTCCNDSCVDMDQDPAHCGSCSNVCPPNRSCVFGKCATGWVPMSPPPTEFAARIKAAYAWTGSQLFLWGGSDSSGTDLATGALYDPATDTWTSLPSSGPLSARVLATAVAAGDKVIVAFGGDEAATTDYSNTASYDLKSQTWSPVADSGSPRRAPLGGWTGTRALFWGGWDKSNAPVTGSYIYDLASGWTAAAPTGGPTARVDVAWAFSPTDLYLIGGRLAATKYDTAFRESLADGKWFGVPKGVSARYGSFGAWDGSRFFVWGGRDDNNPKTDGSTLQGTTWTPIGPTSGGPSPRWQSHRRAGWAFDIAARVVLVAGGLSVSPEAVLTNGSIFDASGASPVWKPVVAWPSGEDHEWGVAVWSGTELLVWGGKTGSSFSLKGERYLP